MMSSPQPLLQVENLSVEFATRRGPLRALDQISFELSAGDTLGIVGESGCGKSITSLAVMGLLPPNGRVTNGKITLQREAGPASLLDFPESELRLLRGKTLSMIFQDPMTSLNPSFTVGFQIEETIRAHEGGTAASIRNRTIELLKLVGIPAPEERLNSYPYQLSGGMSQRVMIAMAIACRPQLLIADEPTTALDVTIQAQILDLLKRLQKETGMALILITHDLGVVAETSDRIAVMYAGQIVETGKTSDVLSRPQHPYTEALLRSLPASHSNLEHRSPLPSLSGMVPDLGRRPSGCQFHPRCPSAQKICTDVAAPWFQSESGVKARCHFPPQSRTGGQR